VQAGAEGAAEVKTYPVDKLRELLRYDADSGTLYWLVTGKGRSEVAGTIQHGRRFVYIERVRFNAARVAWALATGAWPVGVIDHFNGDPLDNRFCNLRDVSLRTNAENQRRPRSDCRAKALGIEIIDDKWRARIRSNGVMVRGPRRSSIEEAQADYICLKRQMHAGCTL
jgi:hypothetical protein